MMSLITFRREIWLVNYSYNYEYNEHICKAICKVGNLIDQIKHNLMRIKDLPKGTDLKGIKVKTKKNVIGYIYKVHEFVVLLTNSLQDLENNKDTDELILFPQVLSKVEDIQNWEVVEDKEVQVNCHRLTAHKYILND